jgi:hypothetical protein
MKILLLSIFVFAAFAGAANAQLCGTYTTTLEIKSEDDKAIETAVVQLIPLKENETRNKSFTRDESDRSKFSITFNEGHIIYAKFRIIVSADGFETAEKEIKFPHCKDQTFEIKLKAGENVPQGTLTGTIYDESGAVIPETEIILTNAAGKKFRTSADEDGFYKIIVLPGIYTVEAEYPKHKGWEKFKIEKYEIASNPNIILDITLKVNKTQGEPSVGTPAKNNN